MSKFKVTKRVSLEFLGEEYKEAYLVFNAITMREYESLKQRSAASAGDGIKSLKFIESELASRFVGGKFPVDGKLIDVTKEDLPDLPGEVFIEAMGKLTGAPDPK